MYLAFRGMYVPSSRYDVLRGVETSEIPQFPLAASVGLSQLEIQQGS